jgi:hypothetical protein
LSFGTRIVTTATVFATATAVTTVAIATSATAPRTITAFATTFTGTTAAILGITWAATLAAIWATALAIASTTTAITATRLTVIIRTGFLGRTTEQALQPAEKSTGLFDGLSSRCAIARITLTSFTRSAWLTGFTRATRLTGFARLTRFTCALIATFSLFITTRMAFQTKFRTIVGAGCRFGRTF